MKKRWAFTEELLVTLLLLGLVTVFLALALGYPSQSRTFPLLVTVPLAAGLAARALLAARVPVGAPASTARAGSESFLTTGWMLGLILIIWLVGMVPAMFLIPFVYMRFYCSEPWRPTLIVSTVLLAATFGFMRWLQIPELQGVLPGLLNSVWVGPTP